VRDGVVEMGRFVDVGVFPMGIDAAYLEVGLVFSFSSSILLGNVS
jgi:hypothetical protein